MGELICLLEILETKFDVIVLTEIGARNLNTVECLLHNYEFHYISPENNMFGGVGIYISDNFNGVQAIDDFTITKTCNCKKCEMESLFIGFSYKNIEFVLGEYTDTQTVIPNILCMTSRRH